MDKNTYINHLLELKSVIREDLNEAYIPGQGTLNTLRRTFKVGKYVILGPLKFMVKVLGTSAGAVTYGGMKLTGWLASKTALVEVPLLIAAYILLVKPATKYTLNVFKEMNINATLKTIDNTLNSDSYTNFAKNIKRLESIQEKKWYKLSIVCDDSAKLAAQAIDDLKKGWIILGVSLILISIILLIVFGLTINIKDDITKAIKELDPKSIIKSVMKLSGFGLLALPALYGVIFICIAVSNFKDKNIASDMFKVIGPNIKTINNFVTYIGDGLKELAKKFSNPNIPQEGYIV